MCRDICTRNHQRTRIDDVVGDVVWQLRANAPWRYKLARIYYTPEVDEAVAALTTTRKLKAA